MSVQSNRISIRIFPEKSKKPGVQQSRLASLSGSLFHPSVFPLKLLQDTLVAGCYSHMGP
jgi:hypothetical protein